NGGALDDERLQVVVQDGRNHLLTTKKKYDVITADPIHPWAYGAAYLYTTEYYAMIREHLAENGVMCQWMPTYELAEENLRSITASFARNFEHNQLWQTAFDAVLIGSTAPIVVDLASLAERLRQPRVAEQLSRIGIEDPLSFLSEFTMDDAGVRRFAEGGPINSDDNLYLEFSSPLSIGTPDGGSNIRLIDSYRRSPRSIVSDWSPLFASQTEVDRALDAHLWAKRQTVAASAELEDAVLEPAVDSWEKVIGRLRAVLDEVPGYGRARVQLASALTGRGRAEMAAGDLERAERSFRDALEAAPRDAHAHFNLGLALLNQGLAIEALQHFDHTLARRPRYPRGYLAQAAALAELGRHDEAVLQYQRAVKLEPQNAQAHFELAVALTRRQRFSRAVEHYEGALALDPRHLDARDNLSLVYTMLGRHAEAIRLLRDGLDQEPDHVRMTERLAWLLATTPDPELRNGAEAVGLAERVVRSARERLPQALKTKAAALADVGRFEEAIATARQAAELAQERNDPALAARIRTHIERYEARMPLRQ
ncbi:MAG: tetratricopeptide repeat protein, partial [Candidatus Krumholzibacteriia bacterium]